MNTVVALRPSCKQVGGGRREAQLPDSGAALRRQRAGESHQCFGIQDSVRLVSYLCTAAGCTVTALLPH
eukprot:4969423-Pyramimonas_sp.AAC.1